MDGIVVSERKIICTKLVDLCRTTSDILVRLNVKSWHKALRLKFEYVTLSAELVGHGKSLEKNY